MALKFTDRGANRGQRVVSAFMRCPRESISGKAFEALEAVRAIQEREGWRIDRTTAVGGTWPPWEPVDRAAYKTLKQALRALNTYARVHACKRDVG